MVWTVAPQDTSRQLTVQYHHDIINKILTVTISIAYISTGRLYGYDIYRFMLTLKISKNKQECHIKRLKIWMQCMQKHNRAL